MSARDLVPFRFEQYDIRVVHIDGEPMIVGKDACEALGYANASDAITRHCKGVVKRYPLLTSGGMQELRVLAEADVLRLIVSSTLPAAQQFERWVFEEVLPSIRRTGSYSVPTIDPLAGLPPEQRALVALMVDNANIKARQDEQAKVLADQAHVQEQHHATLTQVEQRIGDLADSMLMLARPAGSESIVHIRERISQQYGLPSRIIDQVLRQSPIAPKPAGMVKHSREEARGGSYAVYWIKDVSAVFARFVTECKHVTPTQATHPYIGGRFKLAPARDHPPPGGQQPLI